MFAKKEEKQPVVKNIVTLNTYSEKNYIFKNNVCSPLKKLSFNKSNFSASYVTNKNIISTSVKISRSIEDEDIADILDIKAYEDLGLDQANSYVISYMEVENEAEEREYHIFVAEPEELDELFLPVKEHTKFIDLIIPAPLLYKSLYTKEILSSSHTHCFVYFTMHDAFVTIYKNGEYLYSKSIEFSLDQIYDKYCEITGDKVDNKVFFNILETEGLKTINPDYQENFMKIFAEVFITINDIVIYAKRAFELKTIDQMFIGSVNGPIIGLDDYSQNYLGLNSTEFNLDFGVDNDEWYTDQLHYLMMLSSLIYMEDETSIVNLTMYPRPPSFVNRASGQFIISTASAIVLSLAYPLVYLVGSYVNDAKIYTLIGEDKELQSKATKYKGIIKSKHSTIEGLNKQIKMLLSKYTGKTKTLTAIYDKKVNYRLKSGIFHTIAEELTKFEVNIDMLKSDNDNLELSLVSSDDRKFTEVIKYISDKHFDEIVSIDIEKIEKDPINNYYKGLLKVNMR
ncbi:MAG: hypothetical protein QM493_05805 [Sulfurovum sp.]